MDSIREAEIWLGDQTRIRALIERIDSRVVAGANPCPSREEFDAIREFLNR